MLYHQAAYRADTWLYDNVPTTFGVQTVYSGGYGQIGLEGQGTLTETWLLNWRSGQLDKFVTAELGGGLASPGGALSQSIGVVEAYGASTNDSWKGNYADITVSGYLGLGLYHSDAMGIVENPFRISTLFNPSSAVFIDSVSAMPVTTSSGGVGVGLPGVALTVGGGTTVHQQRIFDLDMPFTIIPYGNRHLSRSGP